MTNFTSDSRVGRVLLLPAGLLACSLFTPFTVTAKNDIPVTISQQVRTKIQVNGTVTDATGEPLIGATVLEKASGNGTITESTEISAWQSPPMPYYRLVTSVTNHRTS